jgi:hypothetical protein
VTIHGVDYAWIYQVPPPVPQPRPADFGEAIHLRGFEQVSAGQPGQPMVYKLFWQTYSVPQMDYWLFAYLVGADGTRYTQLDIPYPTSSWGARRYITTELPIALPADVPPGDYRLIIGMYNPATGERLPLVSDYRADPAVAGGDALLLKVGERQ